MITIGENIRTVRKAAGLTQQELAKRTKLSRSYIGDIEKDRYNPSVNTLNLIAQALGVPVQDLLPVKIPEYSYEPISSAEERLVEAYRNAPEQIRQIVDTALAPYAQPKLKEA